MSGLVAIVSNTDATSVFCFKDTDEVILRDRAMLRTGNENVLFRFFQEDYFLLECIQYV